MTPICQSEMVSQNYVQQSEHPTDSTMHHKEGHLYYLHHAESFLFGGALVFLYLFWLLYAGCVYLAEKLMLEKKDSLTTL